MNKVQVKFLGIEQGYNLYLNICAKYGWQIDNDIDQLFSDYDIGHALVEYGDYDDWREVIINHHNHLKAIDIRNGNPYGRYNYYFFAQRDLNALANYFEMVALAERLADL